MTVARRNPTPSGAWHVRIDRVRCQGHARCVALAPEIFEADALGNGRAIGDGAVAGGLPSRSSRPGHGGKGVGIMGG